MKIGVLSLQGGYEKHIDILERLNIQTSKVKYRKDLLSIDALIIPGGESSALSNLIEKESLYTPLINFISKYPVYGTCAGLILLSKSIENNNKVRSFDALNITLTRNGWGRQISSFSKIYLSKYLKINIRGFLFELQKYQIAEIQLIFYQF